MQGVKSHVGQGRKWKTLYKETNVYNEGVTQELEKRGLSLINMLYRSGDTNRVIVVVILLKWLIQSIDSS